MPVIRRWFDNAPNIPWETSHESPWSDTRGALFYTYPLTWLVPYVEISSHELIDAPTPLWITDISPNSQIGRECSQEEGTFIIDLQKSFEEYIASLAAHNRKKFRGLLRKNEDLDVRVGTTEELEMLWPLYVTRLNELALKAGGERYTEKELRYRKNLYTGSKIRLMSFYLAAELVGLNISLWEERTVFDLACIIKPSEDILKRSIGSFAILKNIELAISQGMDQYDLLSREYGYKESFGAQERKLRCLIVCTKEFAKEYKIPEDLFVEDMSSVQGVR